MCNFSQGVWEKGMEKGIEKGMKKGEEMVMVSVLKKLIRNMNLTKEQAADAMEIPREEREKYFKMIQQ